MNFVNMARPFSSRHLADFFFFVKCMYFYCETRSIFPLIFGYKPTFCRSFQLAALTIQVSFALMCQASWAEKYTLSEAAAAPNRLPLRICWRVTHTTSSQAPDLLDPVSCLTFCILNPLPVLVFSSIDVLSTDSIKKRLYWFWKLLCLFRWIFIVWSLWSVYLLL